MRATPVMNHRPTPMRPPLVNSQWIPAAARCGAARNRHGDYLQRRADLISVIRMPSDVRGRRCTKHLSRLSDRMAIGPARVVSPTAWKPIGARVPAPSKVGLGAEGAVQLAPRSEPGQRTSVKAVSCRYLRRRARRSNQSLKASASVVEGRLCGRGHMRMMRIAATLFDARSGGQ